VKTFRKKVAAITGASSGIGRALALELAAQGCELALASNSNQKALAETARLARRHKVKVSMMRVDVADRAQVQTWADAAIREHGQVHLVINNAGVVHAGTVEKTPLEDYEWLMAINYWGVVYGTKAFLPQLLAQGEGHVVNVSSVFGLFAQPGMSAYNSSKFAVRGFTESLRQELDLARRGVSATCVHPGGIKTNIAAAGRVSESIAELTGKPPDAASADFEKLFRTTAEQAARQILAGVRRNARRVLIGVDARSADAMQRLLPGGYQWLVGGAMRLLRR
jgi:short-subunit dehydrogenase